MEDDAGGGAQIVLRLATNGGFREARGQILEFTGEQTETVADAIVKAAAERHGKGVVGVYGVEQVGTAVRRTKKRFRKGMNAPDVAEINAWAKQIGRRGAAV